MKIQLGDKIKMLAKNQYETVDQLFSAAKSSFPKKLADREISLKYADEDGDWIYLSEDDDLKALEEYASGLEKKKVKLFIDLQQEQKVSDEVEEVKQALDNVSLKDVEMKEDKPEFKDLKDFKFSDFGEKIEQALNSEENIRPKEIFNIIKEAAQGTKAEHHFEKFGNCGKRHGGKFHPFKKCGKMMKRFFKRKSHSREERNNSSSPDMSHPPFYGPMAGYGPACYGPMGPFPGAGFHHNPHKDKEAKKFFKKFMKAYRSSSSDGISSEERREKRRLRREQRKNQKDENKEEKEWKKNRLGYTIKNKEELTFAENSENTLVCKAGEQINILVGIQDKAPYPIWLTGVKKVEGDEAIKFEPIEMEEAKVFREEEHEVVLTVTLPSEAGEYPASFCFSNKKGSDIPGNFDLTFRIE